MEKRSLFSFVSIRSFRCFTIFHVCCSVLMCIGMFPATDFLRFKDEAFLETFCQAQRMGCVNFCVNCSFYQNVSVQVPVFVAISAFVAVVFVVMLSLGLFENAKNFSEPPMPKELAGSPADRILPLHVQRQSRQRQFLATDLIKNTETSCQAMPA